MANNRTIRHLPTLRWGVWEFDRDRLALATVNAVPRYGYTVDLAAIRTPGDVLTALAQAKSQRWGSRKVVGMLFDAISEMLDIQSPPPAESAREHILARELSALARREHWRRQRESGFPSGDYQAEDHVIDVAELQRLEQQFGLLRARLGARR